MITKHKIFCLFFFLSFSLLTIVDEERNWNGKWIVGLKGSAFTNSAYKCTHAFTGLLCFPKQFKDMHAENMVQLECLYFFWFLTLVWTNKKTTIIVKNLLPEGNPNVKSSRQNIVRWEYCNCRVIKRMLRLSWMIILRILRSASTMWYSIHLKFLIFLGRVTIRDKVRYIW